MPQGNLRMSARWSGIAQAVIATAAGIALLYFLRDILIPFILACVLAVLVNALVRFIGNQSPWAPRWASVLVAGLLVLLCAVVTAIIFARVIMISRYWIGWAYLRGVSFRKSTQPTQSGCFPRW